MPTILFLMGQRDAPNQKISKTKSLNSPAKKNIPEAVSQCPTLNNTSYYPFIYSPRITKAELFLALPSNLIDFYNIEIFLHILMYARNFDFRKSDVIKNYVGCRLYHKLIY